MLSTPGGASMGVTVALFLSLTSILLNAVIAAFVIASWRRASRSTRPSKQPESPAPIPASELASLQVDQAALFSSLEKLSTTVKRLSSREGMRRLREEKPSAPPVGAPKRELLKYY